MEGWVKIHRKIAEWEWYSDSKTVHLFIHLLLNANHKDGSWKGQKVKRGQFITGMNKLNATTGISIQSLKTCLKRLESTKEVTIKATTKNTVFTLLNYDLYQSTEDTNKPANKRSTNKQQTNNKPSTTNKNDNNEENEKNDNNLIVFNEDVDFVYDSVIDLFPERTQPYTETKTNNWKDIIKKLIDLDKIDKHTIIHVCQKARLDKFWSTNFMSITKLRKNNNDGIKYIDYFIEHFKTTQSDHDQNNQDDELRRMQQAHNL